METKMITIPFDVERAKKIQAGEEPGKIVTREGCDVRDDCKRRWVCALFNFYDRRKETSYPFVCIGGSFRYCIPYNDQTKHLLGTTEDWEE